MPITLPRRNAALACGLASVLALGLLTVAAQPAAAISGTVESSATGIKGNVTLLNAAPVTIAPSPYATSPAGPAHATAAPVSITGVANAAVLDSDTTGDPLADTTTASGGAANLNLLGGLVTTGAISASCSSDGTGSTGSSSVANPIVTLPLGLGTQPVTVNATGSTVVPIQALGVNIATLTLNDRTTTTTGGLYTTTVRALHLHLLAGAAALIGTGDVVVGEAVCTSTIPSAPTATSVSPTAGPTGGSTLVTFNGTNLLAVSSISFGGVAGTIVSRNSQSQITVLTPGHIAGPVDVRVTNPAGNATLTGGFSYRDTPTVTWLSPTAGPVAGGTSVVITGTGFDDISDVRFDGVPAITFTRNSSTRITAIAPGGAAGTADVTVIGAGGTSANSAADDFTYVPVPSLTGLSPAAGPVGGGTVVTLTGTDFTAGSSVTVDGATVAATVVNHTSVQITMPAHATGSAPVVISTPGGSTSSLTYGYQAIPVVTGLSPMWGPDTGGTVLTVTGTGLAGVTSVTIDGVSRPISNQTATSLQVTTPTHAAGGTTVTLTGPGTGSSTAGTFTFTAPATGSAPTVFSVSPDHAAAGGTVTISGTGFTAGSTVSFGGFPAASVTFLDANTLVVGVPVGAGVVAVQVTTPGGTSVPSGTSTFTYPPTITSVSPDHGPAAGGTIVTIEGTGFTPATVVLIGGIPVTPTYLSATRLSVALPAHVVGDVDLAVQLNGVTSDPTEIHYLNSGTGTPTPTPTPTASPTSSPSASPTSSPTTSPTTGPTSEPTQDGLVDPTSSTGADAGLVDVTDSASGAGGSNNGTAINGDGATGTGTGSRDRNSGSATTATASAGNGATPNTASNTGDGGVTSDAETGVFNSALHSKLGWGLLLALLAALATGWALFGGAYTRRRDARLLADALEKYWAGLGPAVESEAVAVMRIPRLGEDWRWPVYRVTGPEVLQHGVGLRSGDILGEHPGDVDLAGLASSPFHPLPNLPYVVAGDTITVLTPHRIFTYRATGGGIGNKLPAWGRSGDEGGKFSLTTCNPAGLPDEGKRAASLHAVLERINHRTPNGEAPLPLADLGANSADH